MDGVLKSRHRAGCTGVVWDARQLLALVLELLDSRGDLREEYACATNREERRTFARQMFELLAPQWHPLSVTMLLVLLETPQNHVPEHLRKLTKQVCLARVCVYKLHKYLCHCCPDHWRSLQALDSREAAKAGYMEWAADKAAWVNGIRTAVGNATSGFEELSTEEARCIVLSILKKAADPVALLCGMFGDEDEDQLAVSVLYDMFHQFRGGSLALLAVKRRARSMLAPIKIFFSNLATNVSQLSVRAYNIGIVKPVNSVLHLLSEGVVRLSEKAYNQSVKLAEDMSKCYKPRTKIFDKLKGEYEHGGASVTVEPGPLLAEWCVFRLLAIWCVAVLTWCLFCHPAGACRTARTSRDLSSH
jgi:hypothetical protein